jgi:predicted ATPase
VTLVGVPGIGKSRLVAELFSRIDSDPSRLVLWRQGRSLPYGDGVTFWALSEMVKAQAGILETVDELQAEEKLDAAVASLIADPGDAKWISGHLRPLAGVSAVAEPAGDRRDEAFTAWRRFFEALSEQNPLVLVFEDLHWADDNLLDFVEHPCRLGRRRSHAGRLQHQTRAVRATSRMGGKHAQCGQDLARPALRR